MQTPFYASGFLYSSKTHQILLLQSEQEDNIKPLWSTLGGEGNEEEDAQTAFLRIINKLLNLNLKEKDIYPVYDYFHDAENKTNYVFYAQVKSPQEFNSPGGNSFSWVTFNETPKLKFTSHSKQDVIVGERVINAKWREDEASREIPHTD